MRGKQRERERAIKGEVKERRQTENRRGKKKRGIKRKYKKRVINWKLRENNKRENGRGRKTD